MIEGLPTSTFGSMIRATLLTLPFAVCLLTLVEASLLDQNDRTAVFCDRMSIGLGVTAYLSPTGHALRSMTARKLRRVVVLHLR